jgi:dimethylargininase
MPQLTLIAITRGVSPALNRCELSWLPRQEIDLDKAGAQHRSYEQCLRDLGAEVISLPSEPDLPDSMFVEDPAVVVPEMAIITRMGAESRRREAESLAPILARYRPLRYLREPATLEGGDVLRIGKTLFVGHSGRTNADGIDQFAAELSPLGYSIFGVRVDQCLHLKSACSYLGEQMVLANPEWVETGIFESERLRIVEVAPNEPCAANVLAIGGTVVVPATFPETAALIEQRGFSVRTLDISELMKAEAGLTCSSILLSA